MKKSELKHIIREVIEEEVLGSDTPIGMSSLDMDLAKTAAKSGQGPGSPDVKSGTPSTTIAVGELRPAQKEVIAAKAVCFALGNLRDGTPPLNDMGAIISNDSPNPFIMDGHHRWAAQSLIDLGASVNVAQINLPADELITVLNIYTKGISGTPKGNSGHGAIANFKTDVPDVVATAMQSGTGVLKYHKGPWPILTAEEVEASLAKMPGANGDAAKGAEIMISNAQSLNTDIHPNAPSRINMPVIDASEIPDIIARLEAGTMDIHPSYSDATKAKMNMKQAAQETQLYERFQKLANIK